MCSLNILEQPETYITVCPRSYHSLFFYECSPLLSRNLQFLVAPSTLECWLVLSLCINTNLPMDYALFDQSQKTVANLCQKFNSLGFTYSFVFLALQKML